MIRRKTAKLMCRDTSQCQLPAWPSGDGTQPPRQLSGAKLSLRLTGQRPSLRSSRPAVGSGTEPCCRAWQTPSVASHPRPPVAAAPSPQLTQVHAADDDHQPCRPNHRQCHRNYHDAHTWLRGRRRRTPCASRLFRHFDIDCNPSREARRNTNDRFFCDHPGAVPFSPPRWSA